MQARYQATLQPEQGRVSKPHALMLIKRFFRSAETTASCYRLASTLKSRRRTEGIRRQCLKENGWGVNLRKIPLDIGSKGGPTRPCGGGVARAARDASLHLNLRAAHSLVNISYFNANARKWLAPRPPAPNPEQLHETTVNFGVFS